MCIGFIFFPERMYPTDSFPVLEFVLCYYRELYSEMCRELYSEMCRELRGEVRGEMCRELRGEVRGEVRPVDVVQISVDEYPVPLYISQTNAVYLRTSATEYVGKPIGRLENGVLYLNHPPPDKN